MIYKNIPNSDHEILSSEDEKLRNMIGNLKRIDAPKNFEMRLKARIAGTASNNFQPRFLPVLRYVLPLSTILVIFAFVILNGLYFPENQTVSQITPEAPQLQIEQNLLPVDRFERTADTSGTDKELIEETPINQAEQAQIKKAVKPQFIAAASPVSSSRKNPVKKEKKDDGGGSRDSALSVPPINLTPKGITLNSPVATTLKPLNAQEILSQLGIEAVFTNAGCNVKSVSQETLGVKVGDVIESIDGEKLTDKLLYTNVGALKKLMVLRGAEKIEIILPIKK